MPTFDRPRSPRACRRPLIRHGIAVAIVSAGLIAVAGSGGGSPGDTAPTIVAQPTSTTAQAGSDVTFSVTVGGNGLSFRWQLSTDAGLTWTDIANAIAAQYTVVAPTLAMNGYQYRAVVSNGSGQSVTTTPVTLTVTRAVGEVFRDCADLCPELVVLPRGSVQMGVRPATDVFRELASPVHAVTIGYGLAVGRTEVTRAEFARFVQATAYSTTAESGTGCYATNGSGLAFRPDRNWSTPGFAQTDSDPVVCVSWTDAQAYVAWLNTVAPGHGFRLLSEAEWEYAARAGEGSFRYPWGDDTAYQQVCAYANGGDLTAAATVPRFAGTAWTQCADGHGTTAPANGLPANAFGLRHMIGNAWEWVQDGWHANYIGAPGDGSVWAAPAGENAVLYRGGSWSNHPTYLDPSYRARADRRYSEESIGFRVARTL